MPKQCPSLGGYDLTRWPWPHQHRCDRWEHDFSLDHLCGCGYEWANDDTVIEQTDDDAAIERIDQMTEASRCSFECSEVTCLDGLSWVCLRPRGHNGQHWFTQDCLHGHEEPHVASRIPYDPLRVYMWYTNPNPPDFSTLQAELAWLEGGTV